MDFFKKHRTIKEVTPEFLLEKETTASKRVAESYCHHIEVFTRWMRSKGMLDIPMRKITSANVKDFFYYLGKDVGLDRSTCERYLLHVRQLFTYALKHKDIDMVPFDDIILPRKKKDKGAEMIQPSDLKLLLEEIKRVDKGLYLACCMEYYCFIRPGRELRLMKVGDIYLDQGLIKIRQENAKNGKEQMVTMPKQLIDICYEYEVDKANKTLYLFGKGRRFGVKPVSINTLRYNFNKVRDRLNLSKGYKLYSLKHTGASNLHRSGISMRELMDQLRHTQLETTQHYLKKHCGIVNDRIRDNFPNPLNT